MEFPPTREEFNLLLKKNKTLKKQLKRCQQQRRNEEGASVSTISMELDTKRNYPKILNTQNYLKGVHN